ncbi:MAG: sigma-70 family RNA polymerase sigma factor [Verrucomicrobiota bacterium]
MPDDSRHDEFMALFLEHQPKVYAYVRSLLYQRADADDVMQETASVLWQKFDQFELGTRFDRWAFRTAYHQVRYFRQKKARESKRLHFGDELVETLSRESEEFLEHTEDALAALEICLQKLPERQRKIIQWRFSGGDTNRAIANRIGKSESVVSRMLNKTYEALMKCVSLHVKFDGRVGAS